MNLKNKLIVLHIKVPIVRILIFFWRSKMRVTLTVLAISFMITACTTLQGINETVKGDGVPYIPGI